ncbi:hypothetical protein C364_07017 [Cryptococcus neoformans Bt63]|nr:hypothetical protein C364_07017 [Cryptococcus neoformans var. grubii Bt63]
MSVYPFLFPDPIGLSLSGQVPSSTVLTTYREREQGLTKIKPHFDSFAISVTFFALIWSIIRWKHIYGDHARFIVENYAEPQEWSLPYFRWMKICWSRRTDMRLREAMRYLGIGANGIIRLVAAGWFLVSFCFFGVLIWWGWQG